MGWPLPWFAKGDQVRLHAVALEAPHGVAGAGEAALHFVGDIKQAFVLGDFHGFGKESGRIGQHAVAGEDAVEQQRGGLDAMGAQVGDGGAHIVGEEFADVLCAQSVSIGRAHGAGVGGQGDAGAEGRRELGNGPGDAVVGEAGDDHPGAAGVLASDAQGEVVRLAAGAGEHHLVQASGKVASRSSA